MKTVPKDDIQITNCSPKKKTAYTNTESSCQFVSCLCFCELLTENDVKSKTNKTNRANGQKKNKHTDSSLTNDATKNAKLPKQNDNCVDENTILILHLNYTREKDNMRTVFRWIRVLPMNFDFPSRFILIKVVNGILCDNLFDVTFSMQFSFTIVYFSADVHVLFLSLSRTSCVILVFVLFIKKIELVGFFVRPTINY